MANLNRSFTNQSPEALDLVQEGVFVVDHQGQIKAINESAKRLMESHVLARLEAADQDAVATEGAGVDRATSSSQEAPGQGILCVILIGKRDGSTLRVRAYCLALTEAEGGRPASIVVTRELHALASRLAESNGEAATLQSRNQQMLHDSAEQYGSSDFIGRSLCMQNLRATVQLAAHTSGPVLITGEPGNGAEVIARAIHSSGPHRQGPFVRFDCASIPAEGIDQEIFGRAQGQESATGGCHLGVLRAAEGGTLYLAGVDAIPVPIQSKLLESIDQGSVQPLGGEGSLRVQVRIIAAGAPGVVAGAEHGLREVLKFRLDTISIEVPSLRERKEDIPALGESFIVLLNRGRVRKVESVDSNVWSSLVKHDWPGNVRELRRVIESAVANTQGPILGLRDLPEQFQGSNPGAQRNMTTFDQPLDDILEDVERRTILSVLEHANGKRTQAARSMKISRSRLYRRMEALGIHQKKDSKDERVNE